MNKDDIYCIWNITCYNKTTAGCLFMDVVALLFFLYANDWWVIFPAGPVAVTSWHLPSCSYGTVLLCPSLFHHWITVNELCLWEKRSGDTPSGFSTHHYTHQFCWKQSLNHCHMWATTHRKNRIKYFPARRIHRKKLKICLPLEETCPPKVIHLALKYCS